MGTFSAFIDVGFASGPILVGLVAQAAGYSAGFIAAAGIAFAGVLVLTGSRMTSRAPAPI
jgi:predicted MFS family arabinose efflux permease